MNTNSGIIYYNKGNSCIVRLIVSLNSLRKHYSGQVTVFLEGKGLESLAKNLKDKFRVNIIYDNNDDTTTYVRAVEICMKSPYNQTIWLDSDTLVLDKIDEIFNNIENKDLVIANFAGWHSYGNKIKKRINNFKNISDARTLDDAIKYGPAINCGVYGFSKNSKMFEEWLKLSKMGEQHKVFIPDEVACQILLPKYQVHILPPNFNVSVRYGKEVLDKKIIHYHGRKHCRNFELAELWLQEFVLLLEESNVCDIANYIQYDRQLSKFFRRKHGFLKYVDQAKNAIKKINDITTNTATTASNKDIKNHISNIDMTETMSNNTTVVVAIDTKYLSYFKVVLPNWIKYKNINQFPMIVYANGFNKNNYHELDFLKQYSNIKIIDWDMPRANSQREKMLSSFVFGTARDVQTKYWLKLDVDLFMNNYSNLVDSWMYDYCLVGHRWGYTKPARWIKQLDEWSVTNNYFGNTNLMFEEKNVNKNKYWHKRLQSIVQLHRSDFVRYAANLAGDRLPVPSHDTYLWYVAVRSELPVKRHNFKKSSGVCHKKDLNSMLDNIMQLDTTPQQKASIL
jgi:hypothetical protein